MNEQSIFTAALDQSTNDRRAFLDEACAGDLQLRQRIKRLLHVHDATTPFFEKPAAAILGSDTAPLSDLIGTSIGPYKLIEQIGHGGFGTVYMAAQTAPVRRMVALKILKPGMDSKEVIARFEAERQALALMDHPNIARVFDAGTTGEGHGARAKSQQKPLDPQPLALSPSRGRPYFVMELVRGAPITDYCDQARLDTRARLTLFLDVCRAVQHAHMKGVIHRDIKPSNVMVTLHDDKAVVKVIDFGIAKALDQSLTEQTLHTGYHQLLGSPLYMSPEQAQLGSLDVDTRSDVYSLGVLLYELLTGTTPFDKETLQQASFDELREFITQREPPRPSARLSALDAQTRSTLAGRRQIDERTISDHLRGELDWIVMRVLEKDRTRRYQSANDLAEDIQRYLDDEPVEACPPSVGYRLRKYARRHKGLLVTTGLVSLTALAGTAVSLQYAHKANNAALATAEALTLAQDNFTEAEQQKTEAERQARQARRAAYVADMRFAFQQFGRHHLRDTHTLLDAQIPGPGQHDLRGLEWYALSTQIDGRFITLGRHAGPVHDIDLFPDGHTFATAGEDGYIRVWDADSRSLLREFHLQQTPVYSVGVSPDGQWLAYGAGRRDEQDVPKPVTIIDAQTGEFLCAANWHKNTIRAVRFSRDGRFLVSGSLQDKVSVWEFTDGVQGRSRDLTGEQDTHSEYFTLLLLDNRRLLTEYHNRTGYRVWDIETGEVLQEYTDLSKINVHALAWNRGHHLLAYVPRENHGRTIQFCDGPSGDSMGEYAVGEEVTALAFSPLHSVSAGTAAGILHIVDLSIPPRALDAQTPVGVKFTSSWQIHEGEIRRVRYLDRSRIITAGVDGCVVLGRPFNIAEATPFTQDRGTHFAAAPEGHRIAWSGVDGAVRLAEHDTGQLLATSSSLGAPPMDLAWSADGTHLAAVCQTGACCCWQVEGNALVERLRDSVTDFAVERAGLALSRDGSRLYISGDRGPDGIHVWDVTTGRVVGIVPTLYTVRTLLVSPDDRRLVAAGEGIFVFDRQTHDLLQHLKIGGVATALLFAPDERTLIAGYQDGAIRLWDLEQGRLLRELIEYDLSDAETTVLQLSPDQQTLIAGDNAGRLRFWNTATWGSLGSLPVRTAVQIQKGNSWVHAAAVVPSGDAIDLTVGFYEVGLRFFGRLPLTGPPPNLEVNDAETDTDPDPSSNTLE